MGRVNAWLTFYFCEFSRGPDGFSVKAVAFDGDTTSTWTVQVDCTEVSSETVTGGCVPHVYGVGFILSISIYSNIASNLIYFPGESRCRLVIKY
jgi:hypothetical protein